MNDKYSRQFSCEHLIIYFVPKNGLIQKSITGNSYVDIIIYIF